MKCSSVCVRVDPEFHESLRKFVKLNHKHYNSLQDLVIVALRREMYWALQRRKRAKEGVKARKRRGISREEERKVMEEWAKQYEGEF